MTSTAGFEERKKYIFLHIVELSIMSETDRQPDICSLLTFRPSKIVTLFCFSDIMARPWPAVTSLSKVTCSSSIYSYDIQLREQIILGFLLYHLTRWEIVYHGRCSWQYEQHDLFPNTLYSSDLIIWNVNLRGYQKNLDLSSRQKIK